MILDLMLPDMDGLQVLEKIRNRKTGEEVLLDKLVMPMPGHHNALNATAAIAVADQLGVSIENIRKAIRK